MRRLALAANDREIDFTDMKRADNAHSILRIMSNLFTFSDQPNQKIRRVSEHSKPSEEASNNYSLLPNRRSTVYIKDASTLCGTDVAVARDYVFPSSNAVSTCKRNVEIAKFHGRLDHERLFGIFQVLASDIQKPGVGASDANSLYTIQNPLTVNMMEKL